MTRTQGERRSKSPTVCTFHPNRLAGEDSRPLFNGLEGFANTDESFEKYLALGRGWPGFWPVLLAAKGVEKLEWSDDCHSLFLFYRDALRELWTLGPRANPEYLPFLLGLRWGTVTNKCPVGVSPRLHQVWSELKAKHPTLEVAQLPLLRPLWLTGDFSYQQPTPTNEFQLALYLLFRESWRAKVCQRCGRFFVADKSAQIYCSTACGGGVKRERSLEWWRRVGARQRQAKKSQRKRGK